jgi:outer membrane receptor protein involved in Fe transport
MRNTVLFFGLILTGLIFPSAGLSQVMEGEVRVTVQDPQGRPATALVRLVGRNPDFQAQAEAGADGVARLQRLPIGAYSLSVERTGFERYEETVEIRSAVPFERTITLRVGVLATEVDVRDAAPLLDVSQPAMVIHSTREQLETNPASQLGRSTIDAVAAMPGWLLEANAVLHPRGSEYDTQYVIDGMPLYDNRSIAFAPAFETYEFEAINVMTAGLSAEYGRRLGGVIALDTRRIATAGKSSEAKFQTGTFGSHALSLGHQQRWNRWGFFLGGHAGSTDRYLDPPSLENFTNTASMGGFHGRLDWDVRDNDHLSFYLRSNRTNFLVPNDLIQQAAGQRQDRRSSETAVQAHYQHVFSSRSIGSVRGMYRDLEGLLWSNPESTPVWVDLSRGLREGVVEASFTADRARHTLKFGGDLRVGTLRERLLLAEPDELPAVDVSFAGRETSTEASVYIQDQIRFGNFSANLGVRFDSYKMLESDDAFSPRVALSYYLPFADVQLRAAYDRIFQPPPSENLLFSSAAATLNIPDVEDAVPVPASRAHFFEVGFRKPLFNLFRLDVSHYWRMFRNSIDDDVFLNTGVSFPITFDVARVNGTEVRLELPRWGKVNSWISYANMVGHAASPVTGGLFIEGGEADELRNEVIHFSISQDQRNTFAGQVRFSPIRRLWFLGGVRYGSGLPVELEEEEEDEDTDPDPDPAAVPQPISQEILDEVDLARGRVRPNFNLDLSAGIRLWERETRSIEVQFDLKNATDRLNVINFSGVFSGTALAPGRQFTFQTRLRF